MKITSIKGFADILPGEVESWQLVETKARQVFNAYNFAEIRIPILEKTELFSRSCDHIVFGKLRLKRL